MGGWGRWVLVCGLCGLCGLALGCAEESKRRPPKAAVRSPARKPAPTTSLRDQAEHKEPKDKKPGDRTKGPRTITLEGKPGDRGPAAAPRDQEIKVESDLPPPTPAPPPDRKTARQARRLLERGRLFYSRGEYEEAEEMVKEAVTLYPFMAEANLLLGKIFLIRGSALRDRAMINSARLMFEMARALDADLREAAVLLELFVLSPPE